MQCIQNIAYLSVEPIGPTVKHYFRNNDHSRPRLFAEIVFYVFDITHECCQGLGLASLVCY